MTYNNHSTTTKYKSVERYIKCCVVVYMAETKFVFKSNRGDIKKVDAAVIIKRQDSELLNTEEIFGYQDAEYPLPTMLQTAQKTRSKTKAIYQEDVLEFTTESAKGLSNNLPVSTAGESLVGVPKSQITCDSSSLEFDNPKCSATGTKINPVVYQYRGV